MENKFLSHMLEWFLLFPLLTILLLPGLFKIDDYKISDYEFTHNISMFGDDVNEKAVEGANKFYRYWLVDKTGLCEFNKQAVVGHDQVLNLMSNINGRDHSIKVCQNVKTGFYRLIIFKNFLLSLVLISIIAFSDGLLCRAADKFEFGYQNPAIFNIATHSAVAVMGMFLVLPFTPMSFNWYSWPLIIGVLLFAVRLSGKNFQTGA